MQTQQKEVRMVLIPPKQIRDISLPELLRQATVTVSGYFYAVDLGPEIQPQHHRIGKDRGCTCPLGMQCPAVRVVADYLREGGERAPDPPPGYYPVAPGVCPVCGARAHYEPTLSSRVRGAGWICANGGKSHYWQDRVAVLRKALAENPWVFPPVVAADGRVLYPGLKRDEIATGSGPWPEGYNPDR